MWFPSKDLSLRGVTVPWSSRKVFIIMAVPKVFSLMKLEIEDQQPLLLVMF